MALYSNLDYLELAPDFYLSTGKLEMDAQRPRHPVKFAADGVPVVWTTAQVRAFVQQRTLTLPEWMAYVLK